MSCLSHFRRPSRRLQCSLLPPFWKKCWPKMQSKRRFYRRNGGIKLWTKQRSWAMVENGLWRIPSMQLPLLLPSPANTQKRSDSSGKTKANPLSSLQCCLLSFPMPPKGQQSTLSASTLSSKGERRAKSGRSCSLFASKMKSKSNILNI